MRPSIRPVPLSIGVGGSVAVLLGALAVVPTAAAAGGQPRCRGEAATIVGTAGNDFLTGTGGDDVAWLGPGGDSFDALGGDDLVCAGSGFDYLTGGPGRDVLNGGSASDSLEGGPDDDILRGGGAEDRMMSGAGDGDTIIGGRGSDFLDLLSAAQPLVIDVPAGTVSGDGDKTIDSVERFYTGTSADVFRGSAVAESYFSAGGRDDVTLGAGDDVSSVSGAGSGTLRGGAGDDQLEMHGDGTLVGGRGNDVLRPHGEVTAVGMAGDDLVENYGKATTVAGGTGYDTLNFHPLRWSAISLDVERDRARVVDTNTVIKFGPFELYVGTRMSDLIRGSAYADRINGSSGDDVIRGLGGDDHLRGNLGHDTVRGGHGDDWCTTDGDTSGCEKVVADD